MSSAAHVLDAEAVRHALNDVHDPEMPIGLDDLGVIDGVELEPGGAVRVTLLPTFAGCPAVELIRTSVEARVRALGVRKVAVSWSFAGTWSPERVSPAGIAALREHGISPGARRGTSAAARESCPYCGSPDVVKVSGFGGSLCRATFRCGACRDTFESLKPSGIAPPAAAGIISLL